MAISHVGELSILRTHLYVRGHKREHVMEIPMIVKSQEHHITPLVARSALEVLIQYRICHVFDNPYNIVMCSKNYIGNICSIGNKEVI